MLRFDKIYHPHTARPYLSGEEYQEHRPGDRLRPYVACYWTMPGAMSRTYETKDVLVVPDTCMDILVRVNHTQQKISAYLCCMQDHPFLSGQTENEESISFFAIRFYFWSAHLFLNLNFKGTGNQMINIDALGREWSELFEPFFYITAVEERIAWTETFLLRKLVHADLNADLFNSIERMLNIPGRATVKDVCEYSCVSQRQMERLFLQKIGLPLKRVYNLIRYQNVWNDMVTASGFHVQDAVFRYGYTDQAHLLKEFKRFHGVTAAEARKIAWRNR